MKKTTEKYYKLNEKMAKYLTGFSVHLRDGDCETLIVIPHSETEEGQECVRLDIDNLKKLSA